MCVCVCGGGGSSRFGGQGICERRIEVIMKMQRKVRGPVRGGGGQGGCVRKIEVVKMPQKSRGSGRGSGWMCTLNWGVGGWLVARLG